MPEALARLIQPSEPPAAAESVRPSVASWRLLAVDEPTAAGQMAFDEALAQEGAPTLRLFRWSRPALSIGYRQTPPAWADPEALKRQGVELVERPTGGGVAVHGSDLSCSIVAPHEATSSLSGLMALICRSIADGVRTLGVIAQWRLDGGDGSPITVCLTEASPYALMVDGRKLCGFAVRRYAGRWLIQGSMLVRPPPEAIRQVLPAEERQAFAERAIALQQAAARKIFDEELIAAVARAWRTHWGVPCEWAQAQWPRPQAAQWLHQEPISTKWWRRTFAPAHLTQPEPSA